MFEVFLFHFHINFQHNLQASQKQHHDFIRALVTIICQHTAEGKLFSAQTCKLSIKRNLSLLHSDIYWNPLHQNDSYLDTY